MACGFSFRPISCKVVIAKNCKKVEGNEYRDLSTLLAIYYLKQTSVSQGYDSTWSKTILTPKSDIKPRWLKSVNNKVDLTHDIQARV